MSTRPGNRTALLVVDVQRANTTHAYERDAVYDRIRDLIYRAKSVGVPVIWTQHHTQDAPMAPGSGGWQIVPEVAPPAGSVLIAKCYSDAFADTDLGATLDELGVGRLVVCGAATEACIRVTTMRAMAEGYDTTLVADAHTTDLGPWGLPLPEGRTVPVSAEQMIAFTNFFIQHTHYPAVATNVVPAGDVVFEGKADELG